MQEAVGVQASPGAGWGEVGPPQCVLCCAKSSLSFISVNPRNSSVVPVTAISILQRRLPKLREIE